MNKVFDLFILDVDLNTLWKKKKLMVGGLDGNDKEDRQSREKESPPLLRRAMAHENTALFHLDRRHTTQNVTTQHCAHKVKEYNTFDTLNRRLVFMAANCDLKSDYIYLSSVGIYSAMTPSTYLFSFFKIHRLIWSGKKKEVRILFWLKT